MNITVKQTISLPYLYSSSSRISSSVFGGIVNDRRGDDGTASVRPESVLSDLRSVIGSNSSDTAEGVGEGCLMPLAFANCSRSFITFSNLLSVLSCIFIRPCSVGCPRFLSCILKMRVVCCNNTSSFYRGAVMGILAIVLYPLTVPEDKILNC